MKKQDIVAYIAKANNLSQKLSKQVFESVLDAITNGLNDGQKVAIMGFGTFEKKKISRKLKAPNTKEAKLYSFTVVRFKQGANLKK